MWMRKQNNACWLSRQLAIWDDYKSSVSVCC